MGLRFRKSVKMGPVRVNFSKSGVGYSVGTKGYRVTKKANGGTRTTVSVPGTGISYVTETGAKKAAAPEKKGHPILKGLVIGFLILLVLGFLLSGCGGSEPSPAPSEDPAPIETPIQLPDPSEDPLPSPEPEPEPLPPVETSPAADPVETPEPTPSVEPEPEPEPTPEPSPSAVAPSVEPAPEPSPEPTPSPSPSPSEEPKPEPTPEPSPSEAVPSVAPSADPADTTPYILNTNTKKFHETTCKSVPDIKPHNLGEITGRDNAIAQGYSPCGRCKP